ncbi:MAG TPA: hypothetical protein VHC63_02715 [Acidimicrobiales bacterium]|nr:hypothetical protein [Acidimicrobiales bacterium]
MIGALIIALLITIGIPVAFMVMGMLVSLLFGWTLGDTAEADHPGSELIDTNY